ncbi:hypothetical protein, partial [Porcincola intestinalis]|uniref:hypothetical protein n=1 Tax=Porcincola intestinalis TaxID=2606632 RepID=UPI00197C67B4
KAAAEAASLGLPELVGSPKQIAWADKIRVGIVNTIADCNQQLLKSGEDAKNSGKGPEVLADIDTALRLVDAFSQVISAEKSASKIIDWSQKTTNVFKLVLIHKTSVEKDIKSGKTVPEDLDVEFGGFFVEALKLLYSPKQTSETVKEEASVTLVPEDKKSDTMVSVKYTDDMVTVESPKDSTVIKAVKAAGFRWDGYAWKLNIGVTTGKASDRAADIANKLLNAGLQVSVPASIRDAAVFGTFTPRCTRWVFGRSGDSDHVYVSWGRDEDMYYKVKSLAGAKWIHDLHYIRIPASSADEIEDFAAINGFQISPGAAKILDGYRKSVQIVAPEEKNEEKPQDESEKLKSILNSSREVIEDLKDD